MIEDVEREQRTVRFSSSDECGVIVEAEIVFEPENGGAALGPSGSSRERANEGRARGWARREEVKRRERERERAGESKESHERK